jgi:hypothetical protein
LWRLQRRDLNTSQALDHALGFVDDAADGCRFCTHLVAVGVHHLDELLAGMVWTVLVEGVVEVEEDGFDVGYLFASLELGLSAPFLCIAGEK